MIKYCKTCLLPSTKPYIKFDTSGICKPVYFIKKNQIKNSFINWGRKNEFVKLIEKIKKINAPNYDVCVPVSGGKDSITSAIIE